VRCVRGNVDRRPARATFTSPRNVNSISPSRTVNISSKSCRWGGGPPPGGTSMSISVYRPAVSSPATTMVYVSPAIATCGRLTSVSPAFSVVLLDALLRSDPLPRVSATHRAGRVWWLCDRDSVAAVVAAEVSLRFSAVFVWRYRCFGHFPSDAGRCGTAELSAVGRDLRRPATSVGGHFAGSRPLRPGENVAVPFVYGVSKRNALRGGLCLPKSLISRASRVDVVRGLGRDPDAQGQSSHLIDWTRPRGGRQRQRLQQARHSTAPWQRCCILGAEDG
jgi:hypothetical protein